MDNIKITNWQGILIIVSTIFPTALLTVPSAVANYSFQSAWISVLIATLFALVITFFVSNIFKNRAQRTIFEITEFAIGGWAAKALGLLFSFYYFSTGFFVLYQFADFMSTVVMVETPIILFSICITIAVSYQLFLGIEVIARTNTIIVVGGFIALFMSTIFSLQNMELQKLLPLNEVPLSNILLGAYAPIGWLSEVAILLIIAPYFKNTVHLSKIGYFGVIITGLSLAWAIVGSILIFGTEYVRILNYPAFKVFQQIAIGGFLERIDAVFIAIWTSMIIMKTAIFMFGAMYSLCEPFKINQRSAVIIPVMILAILYSTVSWEGTYHLFNYSANTFPTFVLFFNAFIPFLLFVIVMLKNNNTREEL